MKGYTPPAREAASARMAQRSAVMHSPNALAEPYRGVRSWPKELGEWPKFVYDSVAHRVKDLYTTSKVTSAVKGFDLNGFKREAAELYEEISRAISTNSLGGCRHDVTDRVMSEFKSEAKKRTKSGWARMRWNLGPKWVEKVNVVQARLVAASGDVNNAFAQFTVRFESMQEFGAYDEKDRLVAGDPPEAGANLRVVDYWVFERSLAAKSQGNQRWRLCGRLLVEEDE